MVEYKTYFSFLLLLYFTVICEKDLHRMAFVLKSFTILSYLHVYEVNIKPCGEPCNPDLWCGVSK